MKKIVLLNILFFIAVFAFSQNPVSLVCAFINDDGDPQLEWVLPPTLCGSVNFQYTIFVTEDLNDTFNSVQFLNDETLTTVIDGSGVGDSGSFYFVRSDCDGVFSYSDTIDLIPPKTPEINFITVLDNGNVELNYTQSPSPETRSYIIYNVLQGNNLNLDTIENLNQLIYIDDANPNAFVDAKEYTIAAMDSCLNTGPLNENTHKTIHLQSFNDSCDNKVLLNWNLYEGWEDVGFARQELHVSNDNGPFEIVDTLTITALSYTYLSFDAQNTVSFKIVAVRNGDNQTTSSNKTTQILEIATIPTYIYPRRASFDENNSVTVEYVIDNNAGIEVFSIKHSEDGQNFLNIETELIPNPIPETLNYFSDDVDGNTFGKYFYISLRDSCGIEYVPSSIKVIDLKTRPVNGFQNELTWNAPIIENSIINQYNIYRQDEDGTFTLLANNPSNQLYYFDFVGEVVPSQNGSHCYRIEAEYSINYPLLPSEDLNMFSNVKCAAQPAVVYTPNAFAPNGTNNTFKGVVINADLSNFVMMILNKWGEVIYQSNDPEIGWDGTVKGKPAPEGAYPYYFRFSNFNGIEKEKKGSVILLR